MLHYLFCFPIGNVNLLCLSVKINEVQPLNIFTGNFNIYFVECLLEVGVFFFLFFYLVVFFPLVISERSVYALSRILYPVYVLKISSQSLQLFFFTLLRLSFNGQKFFI